MFYTCYSCLEIVFITDALSDFKTDLSSCSCTRCMLFGKVHCHGTLLTQSCELQRLLFDMFSSLCLNTTPNSTKLKLWIHGETLSHYDVHALFSKQLLSHVQFAPLFLHFFSSKLHLSILGNSCGVNILCARQRLFCKRHIQTPETVWINCIIPLFCSVLEPHGQWWHFNNRDTVHYSAAPTLCLVCCALVWGVLLWVQSKLAHNTQKLNHFKITIQCFFMYKVVDLTESLDRVHSLLFYILFLFDWYCLSISRPSCHGCNQSVGGTGGCGSVRGW